MMKQQCVICEGRGCRICNNTGYLDEPLSVSRKTNPDRVAALKLVKAGYSYREIMKLLNYKSPRSIQVLLGKD